MGWIAWTTELELRDYFEKLRRERPTNSQAGRRSDDVALGAGARRGSCRALLHPPTRAPIDDPPEP